MADAPLTWEHRAWLLGAIAAIAGPPGIEAVRPNRPDEAVIQNAIAPVSKDVALAVQSLSAIQKTMDEQADRSEANMSVLLNRIDMHTTHIATLLEWKKQLEGRP